MQGTASDLLNGQWTLTVFANPQILSLLGQGWTYREILRVNTLSSRRVRVEGLSARDTVLTLKRRLEDKEGVPVEDQELRRVNMDGATEVIMRDDQQLHETGVRSGDTIFWVHNTKDGDVSLFSAGSNSDGCRMANSAGSEVLTVQEEESGTSVAEGNWWERAGSSSGVLSRGSSQPLSAVRQPGTPAAGAPTVAPSRASVVGPRSDELEREHPSPVERARLVQAAEARAARLASTHGEQQRDPPTLDAAGAASTLAVGHRVKILDLMNPKAQHLNGTCGTVLEYLAKLQRYHVQLDGGVGKAKLKRENLELLKLPVRTTVGPGKLRGAHHPKVKRCEEDTGEVALDVRAMMAEECAKRHSRRHAVADRSAATTGVAGQVCRHHSDGNTGWNLGASTGTVVEPIDREQLTV